MEIKDNQIKIIEGNQEKVFEILFTFESKEFNANYVVYYDNENEKDEEIEVMVSKYKQNENQAKGTLFPIDEDSHKEWEMIQKMIEDFQDREYDRKKLN